MQIGIKEVAALIHAQGAAATENNKLPTSGLTAWRLLQLACEGACKAGNLFPASRISSPGAPIAEPFLFHHIFCDQ
jgi:hypothetical protein